jgi:bifunctional non-homologous end joining protein LigD
MVKTFGREAPTKQREDKKEVSVSGQKVELKHVSKVFWPKEKYTKGDLIEYYRSVASVILPHLKGRPESLKRYPDGITGIHFFQKNAADLAPHWMKTISIHVESENKTDRFAVIEDEASLLYLINLGCIDLNPWNSRVGHLDNPDYLIIDLDPQGVSFDAVVSVAQAAHEILEKAHLPSFPKTSGATGIHIYIPLEARYHYDEVRKFAEILSNVIHEKIPRLTSVERHPDKRKGKVYPDFLQNSKGQTLAAPYSVRPEAGATVSAPLEWDEVKKGLHPSQFTMQNMPARIQKKGDIFKGVLGRGIDMKKALDRLIPHTK